MIELSFEKLRPEAIQPHKRDDGTFTVYACLISDSNRTLTWSIPSLETRSVPTGLRFAAPSGTFTLLVSYRDLAMHGIFVSTSVVLDPLSELRVPIHNGSPDHCYIKHGDPIAQLLLLPYTSVTAIQRY